MTLRTRVSQPVRLNGDEERVGEAEGTFGATCIPAKDCNYVHSSNTDTIPTGHGCMVRLLTNLTTRGVSWP